MSRRRRHQRGSRPRCRRCRAEVLFFRDQDNRWRIVNARSVSGRTQGVGAMPEWGGRLWPSVEDLAAELSTQRAAGVDVVDEVLDLPWYQLHHCQITDAIHDASEDATEDEGERALHA